MLEIPISSIFLELIRTLMQGMLIYCHLLSSPNYFRYNP